MSTTNPTTAGDSLQKSSLHAPPPTVTPFTIAAVAVVALTAAVSYYALIWLFAYIYPNGASGLFTALFVALWLAALIPLIPAVQAMGRSQKANALLRSHDVVGARHHAALGREAALTSMGYSAAILVLATLVAFVSTKDGAIASTFLRPAFIAQAFSDVLAAFWVNVRVALGA